MTENRLGFTLTTLSFKDREPGYIAFRPAADCTYDVLWKIFGDIIRSISGGLMSNATFKVEFTKVKVPVGHGRVRPGLYINFDERCRAIKIKNTD